MNPKHGKECGPSLAQALRSGIEISALKLHIRISTIIALAGEFDDDFFTAPERRAQSAPPASSSEEFDPSGCFRNRSAFPPTPSPLPTSCSSTSSPSGDGHIPPPPTISSTYLAALVEAASQRLWDPWRQEYLEADKIVWGEYKQWGGKNRGYRRGFSILHLIGD